jgi:hypothetical protein
VERSHVEEKDRGDRPEHYVAQPLRGMLTIGSRVDSHTSRQMTLQDLQKQALELPTSDRWQLVQTLLESLKPKTHPGLKKGNLSRLRGIAKSPVAVADSDLKEDYVTYLVEKYQ